MHAKRKARNDTKKKNSTEYSTHATPRSSTRCWRFSGCVNYLLLDPQCWSIHGALLSGMPTGGNLITSTIHFMACRSSSSSSWVVVPSHAPDTDLFCNIAIMHRLTQRTSSRIHIGKLSLVSVDLGGFHDCFLHRSLSPTFRVNSSGPRLTLALDFIVSNTKPNTCVTYALLVSIADLTSNLTSFLLQPSLMPPQFAQCFHSLIMLSCRKLPKAEHAI